MGALLVAAAFARWPRYFMPIPPDAARMNAEEKKALMISVYLGTIKQNR